MENEIKRIENSMTQILKRMESIVKELNMKEYFKKVTGWEGFTISCYNCDICNMTFEVTEYAKAKGHLLSNIHKENRKKDRQQKENLLHELRNEFITLKDEIECIKLKSF